MCGCNNNMNSSCNCYKPCANNGSLNNVCDNCNLEENLKDRLCESLGTKCTCQFVLRRKWKNRRKERYFVRSRLRLYSTKIVR